MRRLACFSLLLFALCAYSEIYVSLDRLNSDGWSAYDGKKVCITDELIVCGVWRDSLLLSKERLFVPEETAIDLANGDSASYWSIVSRNRKQSVRLCCPYDYSLCLGATIRNLKATVTGNHTLLTGSRPAFRNPRFSSRKPRLPEADIVVCCANIQNYFVHLGGYASSRTTQQQHDLQRLKTATALYRLDADIYALCELEKGSAAPAELTAELNRLSRRDIYDYLLSDSVNGDTISVGFIYRKDKISPYGKLLFAYSADSLKQIYARRFMLQGFESNIYKERFVVSLNHLRSKRGTPAEAEAKRIDNVSHILSCIQTAYQDGCSEDGSPCYTDPDILLVGDYNAYSQEKPLQMLVSAGFADMLQPVAGKILTAADSLIYTYSYNGLCGSLDRVYASPSMAAQISYICPIHWNTDYYYSAAFWSKYNFRGTKLTKQAKKNLCFRYADHDPLLIGIKFR